MTMPLNSPAPKAIVLVSGGLDSATTLAIALDKGYEVHALSFLYGQRHAVELEAAQRLINKNPEVVDHRIARIDLGLFGGSALTDHSIAVPKHRSVEDMAHIPITYVPARNTIFLAYTLAFAEVIGAYDIFIGVNAVDYSGYPDCRPIFIEAFTQLANVATQAGSTNPAFTIHAPLIDKSKSDIIEWGLRLGVDYSQTLSCYDPSPAGEACGACDSCILRLQGFENLGLTDPAPYKTAQRNQYV